MYYKQCEHCGANLDPGEKCECLQEEKRVYRRTDNTRKHLNNEIRERVTRGEHPAEVARLFNQSEYYVRQICHLNYY